MKKSWLGTNPQFAIDEDRRNAKRRAEEALRIYQSL